MKKICIILISLIVLCSIIVLLIYKNGISAVSNNSELIEFEVTDGSSYMTISSALKEKNLIKSELMYKIFIKLNKPNVLEAGKYHLSEDMGVRKIVETLSNGSKKETIKIIFTEGKNMRYIAKVISENTSNTEEDVFNLLKDKEYIDSLINEYWFLTDDIKNEKIYYPLEGYLFPDTYEIYKDDNVKDIFKRMLDEMDSKLKTYKTEIENSKYSIHELITLASIVELEGAKSNDRSKVAGVFYNRLSHNWTLGSDVTTYYAEKIDDWSVGLKLSQLNACNAYNTRGSCVSRLPIGPISNPSMDSIKATINPEITKNYYFVADCDGNTYLNTNEYGHNETIRKLKNQGKWCDN